MDTPSTSQTMNHGWARPNTIDLGRCSSASDSQPTTPAGYSAQTIGSTWMQTKHKQQKAYAYGWTAQGRVKLRQKAPRIDTSSPTALTCIRHRRYSAYNVSMWLHMCGIGVHVLLHVWNVPHVSYVSPAQFCTTIEKRGRTSEYQWRFLTSGLWALSTTRKR